jgi:hypothetical protein
MSFTKTRLAQQRFEGATIPDYQMQYMAAEVRNTLAELNGHFLEFLTADIMQQAQKWELRDWLTEDYYQPSNDFAKECLEICLTVKHLYGSKIKPWTDSALKCYDALLLKHLQEDRQERIPKKGKNATEREVYKHLEKLKGNYELIAKQFHQIYDWRNSFQHVQQYNLADASRRPKKFTISLYNQRRDAIIGAFQRALILLRRECCKLPPK